MLSASSISLVFWCFCSFVVPNPQSPLLFFHVLYKLLLCFRSGNEEKLMALLTPLNVNCHASDGRKVRPLLTAHSSTGSAWFEFFFFKFPRCTNPPVIPVKGKNPQTWMDFWLRRSVTLDTTLIRLCSLALLNRCGGIPVYLVTWCAYYRNPFTVNFGAETICVCFLGFYWHTPSRLMAGIRLRLDVCRVWNSPVA